jgi:uncharacterized protein YggT (Ycf19 family)
MTIRKETEEVEDGHGRHTTAVEERTIHGPEQREAVAEDEVVSTHPGAGNVARGWLRVFASLLGVGLAAVETLLGFRLAFLLGEANPNNGFVDFIYGVTDPLVEPFQGIIANETLSGGGVFEPATVIAMVVYLMAAALLIAAILVLTAGPFGGERQITTRSRQREEATHRH